MKQTIITLIVSLFIFSCSSERTDKRLIGDWTNGNMVYSFEDTLCSSPFPSWEYTRYKIIKDSIFIRQHDSFKVIDSIDFWFTYQILSISDTSLKLKKNWRDSDSNYLFDTLNLSRFKKYNSNKIRKITYSSSIYLGKSPSLDIEINKNGNVVFNGRRDTKFSGLYEGKISKNKLNYIQNKVNNISLNDINRNYTSQENDSQTHELIVHFENGETLKTMVYGLWCNEPSELRVLLHRLATIYLELDLKKSSLEKYNFDKLEYDIPPVHDNLLDD